MTNIGRSIYFDALVWHPLARFDGATRALSGTSCWVPPMARVAYALMSCIGQPSEEFLVTLMRTREVPKWFFHHRHVPIPSLRTIWWPFWKSHNSFGQPRVQHCEHCQPILRWLVRVGHQNNPMSNPSYSQNQYTYSPMVSLGTQRHNSMDHQRLCLALFQPLFEMCQLQYVSHVCASELAFSQTFFQRVFTCFSPRH